MKLFIISHLFFIFSSFIFCDSSSLGNSKVYLGFNSCSNWIFNGTLTKSYFAESKQNIQYLEGKYYWILCGSTELFPSNNIQLQISVDQEENKEKALLFSETEGLVSKLSKEIVLPSNNPQFEHAWEEYFFLQCLQNSHIMIKIKVLDLVSGKIFLLTIDVECEAFTWNSSLKNWSHLAMFVPSFFLANWQLIHFFGLIKNNKCNLFVRKTRKCSKLREIIRFIWNKVEYFGEDYLLLLILGLIVTISQSLDSEIRNRPLVSDSNDFGHLNFGILFLGMSILGMFLKIVFQNKVIAFPIPTVLLIIGIAMQHHEQHSIIGNIIHQTFGLAAFGTGIAKILAILNPMFEIPFLFGAQLTPTLFFAGAPFFLVHSGFNKIAPMNYSLVITNVVLGWFLVEVCIFQVINKKCFPTNYHKLESSNSTSANLPNHFELNKINIE